MDDRGQATSCSVSATSTVSKEDNGKRLRVIGKRVPVWLAVTLLVLLSSGAAAAGVVSGDMPVGVSQGLLVKGGTVIGGQGGLFSVSDGGTSFSAAASAFTGETYTVAVALANLSGQNSTGEIEAIVPEGMTLDIAAADGVSTLARTGVSTWRFVLKQGEDDVEPDLLIAVHVGVAVPTGFYRPSMSIRQVKS